MEGGERKEAAALPPDYVSLAQLQERWLQKQEEMKREEEEKRERDALALKQKQEGEKRERDARSQNGFVRATGVIQEKGKEIVCGGPSDGGENNKNIGKKRGRGKKKRNSKGVAAIEEREKVGAEAEVLSGGGAGILSGGGGSGGGSSTVELVGCVSVAVVLPRNGEIARVNRSDLRGGFKKNGRDKGSLRVNELKLSEEEGGEKGSGKKCSESGKGGEKGGDDGIERGVDRVRGSEEEGERRRGSERGGDRGKGGERWSERGGDRGRRSEEEGERRGGRGRGRRKNGGDPKRKINMLKEYRPVISEGNEVELKLENKADQDEISKVRSGIASLRVGNVKETRGRDNRAKEDGAEEVGSNMDKVAVEIEKEEDHRALARKGENRGSGMGYRSIGIRGHDNKAKEDGVEGSGSNGEILAVEIEKKVDHKVVSRKGENRGHGRGYRENGIWGRENKPKEDVVEGGGSNGEEVAVEIEKVDHKVLPRKGENRSYGRAYRENGIRGRENKAKEDGVEGGDSNSEALEVEIEKKVDHKVLPRKGENRNYERAYRENGIQGRENKAKEDGVEGGGSNSETLEVEIEKKVDRKVLPRKGENRSSWSAYQANGNRRNDFGRGRSFTKPDINDVFSVKPRERVQVWVKKEDRLNA